MTDLPLFVEVDLTKTTKHGSDELRVGPTYLCLINNIFRVGHFSKVWFGLNFDSGANSFQYDPPGTNASRWQRAWRFLNAEDIVNQQRVWDNLIR